MRRFSNDYTLTAEAPQRIECQFEGCHENATQGLNNGRSPFAYVCPKHLDIVRATGKFYKSEAI